MKVIGRNFSLILILLFASIFVWNFASSVRHHKKRKATRLSVIGSGPTLNRPFVVFLPGGQGKFSKRGVESVSDQAYPNYRVITLDEDSSETLYQAIHACKDEEILLFLGKEDWLAHEEVLKLVNHCYEDPSVWMTYGNYVEYPSYKKGSSKEKPHLSPLQSGYAGLFKKIKKGDLKWGEATGFVIPASQMARGHVRFISDVLYVYNRSSDVGKEEWEALASLEPYAPLTSWRDEP